MTVRTPMSLKNRPKKNRRATVRTQVSRMNLCEILTFLWAKFWIQWIRIRLREEPILPSISSRNIKILSQHCATKCEAVPNKFSRDYGFCCRGIKSKPAFHGPPHGQILDFQNFIERHCLAPKIQLWRFSTELYYLAPKIKWQGFIVTFTVTFFVLLNPAKTRSRSTLIKTHYEGLEVSNELCLTYFKSQ